MVRNWANHRDVFCSLLLLIPKEKLKKIYKQSEKRTKEKKKLKVKMYKKKEEKELKDIKMQ